MNFLSGMLREEGGLEYKTSIAETIITIIGKLNFYSAGQKSTVLWSKSANFRGV